MPEAKLSAGTIHYEDSGGDGHPLVLLHGLAMDGRLWRDVVPELSPGLRCIAPTLPFGSHRETMRPDADLSLRGFGRLVAEFIESLDTGPVTLCFSDWSGAQPMVADGFLDRVDSLILVSCETEGNYPPGLAGRAAVLSARMPGGFQLMRQTLLRSWSRRLPFIYGQMSKRGVPDDLMRDWLEPLRRAEIRRDLRKYIVDVKQGKRDMAVCNGIACGLRAPRPGGLGQRGADDAQRARPQARRRLSKQPPGRDRGQLHPDPDRPAHPPGRRNSRVRPSRLRLAAQPGLSPARRGLLPADGQRPAGRSACEKDERERDSGARIVRSLNRGQAARQTKAPDVCTSVRRSPAPTDIASATGLHVLACPSTGKQ